MLMEIGMAMIITIIIVVLVYYTKDTAKKVTEKYFEMKEGLLEYENKITALRTEIENKLREINKKLLEMEDNISKNQEEAFLWRLKNLNEKIIQIEKSLKDQERINTKVTYEIGSLKKELSGVKEEVSLLNVRVEEFGEKIKEEIKQQIIKELEEEIERLEEVIEDRKESELREFIEMLTAAINLEPEKLQRGLFEAKKAILSLRDLAKVYVLTEKGKEEFIKLRDNLISLLRNLRKLAVISIPNEEIYSRFNDIIVQLKRLELPMKLEKDGTTKELNPEKSFIHIHNLIYDIIGKLDKIAESVNTPIPVTPIEKEFYEKLREQFEELRKLEQQVQQLVLKLENKESEEISKSKSDEIEKILEELNL